MIGAHLGGINGVALAADGMLLVGCIVLYRYLRGVVDFSLARLVAWPLPALIIAGGTGLALEQFWLEGNTWATAAIICLMEYAGSGVVCVVGWNSFLPELWICLSARYVFHERLL